MQSLISTAMTFIINFDEQSCRSLSSIVVFIFSYSDPTWFWLDVNSTAEHSFKWRLSIRYLFVTFKNNFGIIASQMGRKLRFPITLLTPSRHQISFYKKLETNATSKSWNETVQLVRDCRFWGKENRLSIASKTVYENIWSHNLMQQLLLCFSSRHQKVNLFIAKRFKK